MNPNTDPERITFRAAVVIVCLAVCACIVAWALMAAWLGGPR